MMKKIHCYVLSLVNHRSVNSQRLAGLHRCTRCRAHEARHAPQLPLQPDLLEITDTPPVTDNDYYETVGIRVIPSADHNVAASLREREFCALCGSAGETASFIPRRESRIIYSRVIYLTLHQAPPRTNTHIHTHTHTYTHVQTYIFMHLYVHIYAI